MRINNSQFIGTKINFLKNNSLCFGNNHKVQNAISSFEQNISVENFKANFLPSFGRFRKISEVVLTDRETNNPVLAEIKRDKYGNDLFSYKIFVKGQEAGFMDLNCESLYPEGDFVVPEADNVFPEIKHLRSLMGDKYSGIGTALVNEAINESIKRHKNGSLWLTSEQGYANSFSKYRQNENPIPFYYKLGFKTLNPKQDKYIRDCLESSKYNMLPSSEVLILTSDAVKNRNEKRSLDYTKL